MKAMNETNNKAEGTVTIPQAEYDGLRSELQELKSQIQWLLEQLRVNCTL